MLSRFFLIASTLLLSFPTVASAAVFTTSSEQTRFVLDQVNGQTQVEYTTRIQGRPWFGSAKVSGVAVPESGVYRYQGTFEDFRTGGGPEQRCTGTIEIWHSLPGQSFSVTWKATGGKACPSIGKSVTLEMVDALPRPDARGDFTSAIVEQWHGGTQASTWQNWRVVSTDGALNCRAVPNGAIRRTYKAGTAIQAFRDRSGLATTTANGSPWLKTADHCFVRANSRFIQPTNF